MTDLFFDTDCISAFLWVGEEDILLKLYAGKIVLPRQVFNELSHPSIAHLRKRILPLEARKDILVQDLLSGTSEFRLYCSLAISPPIIGKGEAAAIALAKTFGGTLAASNNLRDISPYISQYQLKHITTADILAQALECSYIDELGGNTIWANMLKKRRLLPTETFSKFLQQQR